MNKVIKANFGGWTANITDLLREEYMDGTAALSCSVWDTDYEEYVPGEVLSTNLGGYGLYPAEGNVFIKDYSEHKGLTDSLVEGGAVEVVRKVTFGPFNTNAYEVKVTA